MSFPVTMQPAFTPPRRRMAQAILPRQMTSRMGQGATETVNPAQADLAQYNKDPFGCVIEAMPRERLAQILPVVTRAFEATYDALPEDIRNQYDLDTGRWITSPEDLQTVHLKKAWIKIKSKAGKASPFRVFIQENSKSPTSVSIQIDDYPCYDKVIRGYEKTQNREAFTSHHQAMWKVLHLAGMNEDEVRWL